MAFEDADTRQLLDTLGKSFLLALGLLVRLQSELQVTMETPGPDGLLSIKLKG